MSTSVAESSPRVLPRSELSGQRVLVTGVSSEYGCELAAGLVAAGCELVIAAGAAVASQRLPAAAKRLDVAADGVLGDAEAVLLAQAAVAALGGVDCVINLIAPLPASAGADPLGASADALRVPFHVGRVIANRMRTTWTSGLIVNVVTAPRGGPADRSHPALAALLRAELAALTRTEAEAWAGDVVRVNSIAALEPTGEAAILALVVMLAGPKGKTLSGYVLDPAEAQVDCC